tara:strand:+ start:239 stop:658 length:420 start_codon:yes stop_codon:yes gene_type:complete
MGAKPGQKMLTVWVDEEERDALQTLCKTNGSSVSSVLRSWILTALAEQTTELVADNGGESDGPSKSAVAPEVLKELMQRMTALEKDMPKFDTDDLVRMKEEVLGGEFGSMRYRLGIVEAQVQSLGGTVAWNKEETDEKE